MWWLFSRFNTCLSEIYLRLCFYFEKNNVQCVVSRSFRAWEKWYELKPNSIRNSVFVLRSMKRNRKVCKHFAWREMFIPTANDGKVSVETSPTSGCMLFSNPIAEDLKDSKYWTYSTAKRAQWKTRNFAFRPQTANRPGCSPTRCCAPSSANVHCQRTSLFSSPPGDFNKSKIHEHDGNTKVASRSGRAEPASCGHWWE